MQKTEAVHAIRGEEASNGDQEDIPEYTSKKTFAAPVTIGNEDHFAYRAENQERRSR